jgi:small subunit ribosomal protein S21
MLGAANTAFVARFVSGSRRKGPEHMLQVDLRDGESGEALLNRFTKMIQKDGILREVKARRHFISPSERERIAQRKAAARRRRRKARQRD